MCAALARLRAIPADVLRSLEDTSPDRFPLRLVEAAQLFTEPVVLILDDVHELADPAVLSGLDLIIRHAPGTLRLVLSARQPPALQLARLRVSGELADIGGPDLACTADEADAYFAMLGIDVDQGARDELLRRTQGWMAGLRLAAMRARSDPEPGAKITDLVGDEPIVTDYLWDEVLGKQPPQTRMFLLRTSITGEVSGDLADALTGQGGSARTLERLSRENSFVEVVDRERGGYAYHPLLREVLAAELHREIPHEIPVLLRRAARWYAAHDQPFPSVRCAAQAEDWDYAAQILAEAGAGVANPGCTAELESVLALFPPDRSADDPAVAAAWAAARLWDGDHEGAAAYLENGEHALGRAAPAMRRVMEPALAALRVMLAGCRCDPDPGLLGQAQSLAERCEAAASAQPEHRAVGLLWFAAGVARLRRWEIQAARHALRHADRQLAAGNLAGLQARARAWRALAEAWFGDLSAAQRSASDVPATRGLEPGTAGAAAELAALARAQVGLRRDDLSIAQRLVEGISQGAAGQFPGEPPVSAMTALIRARVLLADGDATAAVAVLSRLRETYGPTHLALSDVVTVAEGDAALRVGNTGRARAVLLLVEEGEHFDRADGRLLRAGLFIADGEFKAALEAVQPCLDDGHGRGHPARADQRAAHRRGGAAPPRRHRRVRRAARAGARAGRAGRRLPGLPGRRARGPLGDDRADPADQPARRIRRAHPGALRRPGAAGHRARGPGQRAADRQRAGRAPLPALAHDQRGDLAGPVPVHQHGQDPPALGLPQARASARAARRSPAAAASACCYRPRRAAITGTADGCGSGAAAPGSRPGPASSSVAHTLPPGPGLPVPDTVGTSPGPHADQRSATRLGGRSRRRLR